MKVKSICRISGKVAFTVVVSVLLMVSCTTVTPISTNDWWDQYEPDHTKDEIISDFNLHRGKWWNHYARACWLQEGGFYTEAVADFEKALKVRSNDKKSARSYGMHFWDYFARRELGVCYYYLGKFDDAVRELEQSLQSVDSSKAKFYLNKSRESVLTQNNVDKTAPEILVTSFKDGDFVNRAEINVQGSVKDDYFSNSVWINNRKLFVELASKDLSFEKNVKLVPGENTISIKASDLVGNQTSQTLKLNFDMRSPVILLDEEPVRKPIDQKTLTLKGALVDDSGIDRFWINDTEIKFEKGKEVSFNQLVDIPLSNIIKLKAVDVAGNEVSGEYSLNVKTTMRTFPHDMLNPLRPLLKNSRDGVYSQFASVDNSLVATAVTQGADENIAAAQDDAGGTDSAPPKITTDLKAITVYDKYYVISGEVQDKTGISKLLVNDEEIKSNSAKHVFFNHIIALEEGENTINITAEDSTGNKSVFPSTTIKKETYDFMETDSRYTVALLPLKRVGIAGMASDSVYPMLMQGLENEPQRFNFVERDEAKLLEVLKEQKMSNSDMGSSENVIKIGKIRAAEGMLFGTMVEDEKGLNVSINLVDTETTKVLATADVYGEDKSVDNLRWLMKGLSLKIKQKFPMLQGSVVYVSKKGFFVDFGTEVGATLGMKFLLFREIDLGAMKIKEPLDAVAQIVQVDKQTCMAKIISGADTIEKTDLVITK